MIFKLHSIGLPIVGIFLSMLLIHPSKGMSQLLPRPIVRLPVQLRESSGLVAAHHTMLWTLNDSGNTNQIFSFDTLGNLLRTITIGNIQNIDWEDLTSDPQGNFYINDAGNNDNNRQNLAIHILPNPALNPSGNQLAQSIQFHFPDQTAFPPPSNNRNFDIEAIIWRNDSIMLFSKNRSNPTNGYCKHYALKSAAGQQQAMLKDSVFIGLSVNDRVTAAAIHSNGQMLVLLTRNGLVIFDHFEGNSFFKGRKTFLPFSTLPGQVEGIAFVDSQTLYMTEEGSSNQGGLLYEISLPSILSIKTNRNPAQLCKVVDKKLYLNPPAESGTPIKIIDYLGRHVLTLYDSGAATLPQLKPGPYSLSYSSHHRQNSCRIIVMDNK
jgi:uncharacterized protein YjiK